MTKLQLQRWWLTSTHTSKFKSARAFQCGPSRVAICCGWSFTQRENVHDLYILIQYNEARWEHKNTKCPCWQASQTSNSCLTDRRAHSIQCAFHEDVKNYKPLSYTQKLNQSTYHDNETHKSSWPLRYLATNFLPTRFKLDWTILYQLA